MKVWERPLAWTLGQVDETFFRASIWLLEKQGRPPSVSDPAELDSLSANLTNLLVRPPVPQVELRPARWPATALIGLEGSRRNLYRVYRLSYASATPTGRPANDRAHGFYLERNPDPATPALLYLHGWMEFEPGFAMRLPLAWAAGLNLNILALHLPFHFERAPQGTYSGELSLSGNLPLMLSGYRQAVSDVRQALYWLRSTDRARARPVAIAGKSLGGLVGATTLLVEDGFQAAALAVPASGSGASIWQSRYTRLLRRDLLAQGLDEAASARLLEALRPDLFRPLIEGRRILILKASADRVCFPADTDRLARNWGARLVEIPAGHLTATLTLQARRAARAHLVRYLSL